MACFGQSRWLPPRPDYASVLSSGFIAAIVYVVSRDPAATVAAAVTVGLLVFPIAFVAREAFVLARHSINQRNAENVYEWLKSVASLLGVYSIGVAYTSRNNVSGVQVVGLGLMPQKVNSIAGLLHRAAWNAEPIAVFAKGEAIVVVPGYVMARLSELVVTSGARRVIVVNDIDDLKLVYKTIKPIVKGIVGSNRLASYLTVKLINRLIREGLIVLALNSTMLEKAEKLLPFENPILRFIVRRQLELEKRISLV